MLIAAYAMLAFAADMPPATRCRWLPLMLSHMSRVRAASRRYF